MWFARRAVRVERVLTDNGSAYISRVFRAVATRLGLTLKRTRPYRPQINGKAERFIQTLLREWATSPATAIPRDAPRRCGPGSAATTPSALTALLAIWRR